MTYSLSELRKLARDSSIDKSSIIQYATSLYNEYKVSNAPQELLKAARSFINEDAKSKSSSSSFTLFDIETPNVVDGCSVVVPCYNCESTLMHTINSILSAEHNDLLEIILVDDCANSATSRIIKSFADKFTCIATVAHKANSGLGAARNSGIRIAKKPFITFLDSDDLMIKGGVSRRMKALVESRKRLSKYVIGSYGGSFTISEATISPPKEGKANHQKIVSLASTGSDCPFNANQPLFLTEFLRHGFNFPEDRRTAEDWPYWVSLLKVGAIIVPTHEYDVTYRSVPNSMIRKTSLEHLKLSFNFLASDSTQVNSNNLLGYGTNLVRLQSLHENRFYTFAGMAFAYNYSNFIFDSYKLSRDLIDLFEKNLGPVHSALKTDPSHVKSKLIPGLKRYYCGDYPLEIEGSLDDFAELLSSLLTSSSSIFISELSLKRKLKYDLVFFPHKEYHVQSIYSIEKELPKDMTSCVVDFSTQYRDEGVSSYPLLHKMRSTFYSYNEFCIKNVKASLAICFNDWDPVIKQILADLKAKSNTPSLGIVEGVNDYLDVDTGRSRCAYQTVDHLIIPGEFERKYFPNHKNLYIGGIQRLDSIRTSEVLRQANQDLIDVVINSNFSYNVLIDKQEYWVSSLCNVCETLNLSFLISRHPQDGESFPKQYLEKVSLDPLYTLLCKTKIFVTRFSGAVFEALRLNASVIYYNPGIEKIDKFKNPMGAFQYANSPEELRSAIENAITGKFQPDVHAFLRFHANIGNDLASSSQQTSRIIQTIIRQVSY